MTMLVHGVTIMINRIALLLTLIAGCAYGADFTKESLMADIAAMSEMLKDDAKTVELLKTYVSPTEIEAVLKSEGTLESVAAEFNKGDKKPLLLDILQKITPELLTVDAANHTMQAAIGEGRPVVFAFANGHWYINN